MRLKRGIKILLITVISTVLIYLGMALILVFSQSIVPLPVSKSETLSFAGTGGGTSQSPPLISYTARDGTALGVRHYPSKTADAPLVVVVHGSGWHGGAYTPIGNYLLQHGNFEILIPDLRGHGPKPVRRGDVDYTGQPEDDLADLIAAYCKPDQPVYMIGHSSGGGLTIRFAGGKYGGILSKAVLLSPYLKYNAPTARTGAGGWSHVLTRRTIGLSMLNAVGITALNGLHVIQFNFPAEVLNGPKGYTATQSYSYRLNTSFAPRSDYLADVARLPDFLLIAGMQDEAFRADQYKPTLSAVTSRGQYRLIKGVTHLGAIKDPTALEAIRAFLVE